jgi:hypothetical protein
MKTDYGSISFFGYTADKDEKRNDKDDKNTKFFHE